jgi:SAM-dependent methyltransferase
MNDVYPRDQPGHCPICETTVNFKIWSALYRDTYLCERCESYSIPRERALAAVLKRMFPNWRNLEIHESSPENRGISAQLKRECKGYLVTQFFPQAPLGSIYACVRNENLEEQTFEDARFDVVLSQDVLEHVNDFPKALLDVNRTLKPGGAHIFTTPTYPIPHSIQWATYVDGQIQWFFEPEYHVNPISGDGAPVTFHYGYDFPELVSKHCGLGVEVIRLHNPHQGIEGPMNEVYVITKQAI